jgi:adenylate cyclase
LWGFLEKTSPRRLKITLLGTLALSAVASLLALPGTNLPLEGTVYDFLVEARAKGAGAGSDPGVVIIAIDNQTHARPQGSMAEIFSPGVYATILDSLIQAGAKAVAIHRPLPPSESRLYAPRDELAWWAAFAKAARAGVQVIYGFRWLGDSPVLPSPRYVEIMGRGNLGFINLPRDRDQKVRDCALFWEDPSEKEYLGFAFLAAKAVNRELAPPPGDHFYIDYRDSFLKFSFSDVYQRALDGELDFFKKHFQGKLAIIGDTSSLNLDSHPVPVSRYLSTGWEEMAAVEIQAHAIGTLLQRRLLKGPAPLVLWLFFVGVLFIALAPLLLSDPRGVYPLSFLPPLFMGLYALAALFAFHRYVYLPLVPGLVAILLAHLLYLRIRYKETRLLADTRSRALNLYLDPALTGQIISDPEILSRRGEKKACTVFFADFEGFTSLSERMDTQDLVDLVNLYYDTMTSVIENYDGFVDKFVGDAIMAVWGVPLSQPGHAVSACLSALEQRRRIEALNLELARAGKPTLNALMGLNTGAVLAGNIGGKKHKAYTVMGDAVNLASRLVSVNKYFKTTIIASEATALLAAAEIVFRPLDKVRVVGRQKSLNIYEVMGKRDETSPETALMINFFERALRRYFQRDFAGALARFERALAARPDDRATEFFMSRCRAYIKNPPGEDWDGVTELELK